MRSQRGPSTRFGQSEEGPIPGMFAIAEQGSKKVSKAEFKQRLPAIRVDLLNMQHDLRKADFPVRHNLIIVYIFLPP